MLSQSAEPQCTMSSEVEEIDLKFYLIPFSYFIGEKPSDIFNHFSHIEIIDSGHSNVVITEHYLAGLNPDITFGINESIL